MKKKSESGSRGIGTRVLTCMTSCLETLVELAKLVKYHLVLWTDVLLHRLRPQRPIALRRVEGAVLPGSRKLLCVFAHFDRDGLVDEYVIHYLSKLEALGCETIFVSTANGLGVAQVENVRPYCRMIIIRENQGHDFGSWKAGLAEAGDLSRYDRLILANDSVYGPFFDLGAVVNGAANPAADFWGITDTVRFGHHLQSYFMVFGRSILQNPAFEAFWQRLPYYRFKHAVVLGCEIGLSRLLAREGFNLGALCPFDKVWTRHLAARRPSGGWQQPNARLDTTYWCWETLLKDYNCPFLKVRLLRDCSIKFAGGDRWRDVVSQCSSYDAAMIRRHLDRVVARGQG